MKATKCQKENALKVKKRSSLYICVKYVGLIHHFHENNTLCTSMGDSARIYIARHNGYRTFSGKSECHGVEDNLPLIKCYIVVGV